MSCRARGRGQGRWLERSARQHAAGPRPPISRPRPAQNRPRWAGTPPEAAMAQAGRPVPCRLPGLRPSQRDARPAGRPTAGGCHRRGLRSRWPADRGCAVVWPEPTCRALDAADPSPTRRRVGQPGGTRAGSGSVGPNQPPQSCSRPPRHRSAAATALRPRRRITPSDWGGDDLAATSPADLATGIPERHAAAPARTSRRPSSGATTQEQAGPRAWAHDRHAWAAATARMPVLPPSPSPGTDQPLAMGPSRRARQRSRTRPATAQAAQPAGICLARASARQPSTSGTATETGTGAGAGAGRSNRHSPNTPEGAGLQRPPEG
jgi:hypothetical protein